MLLDTIDDAPLLRSEVSPIRSGFMIRFSVRLFLALVLAGASLSAQRGGPIPQQIVFTPYHASGIYDVGETVGWTVTPGSTAPTYAYKWTIRRNNAAVLNEGRLELST